MTENAYGTIIAASALQTYAQAQSVIDTAILVWEQESTVFALSQKSDFVSWLGPEMARQVEVLVGEVLVGEEKFHRCCSACNRIGAPRSQPDVPRN
jgi:hypothetical protein